MTETWLENRIHVKQFGEAMWDKLDRKADEGRGGWRDKTLCSREDLSRMLREHVEKGDPVDVANFCMMLHQRGELIASADLSERGRVKPLDWKEYSGSRFTGESKERHGIHEFGSYVVIRSDGYYGLTSFTNMGKMRPMGDFKTLEEVKAAAQADYEARIFSVFENPTPSSSLGGDCVAVPRERLLKLLEYSDAEYVPNALFSEFRIYLGTAIPAASISSPDGAAEQRDTIAALTICDAMFKWMIAHGLATIDTDYTAADVVTILDDLLITVKPLPSDGLDDCFRHHIVTTIGWPAFSMRPGREMQMYEEGFKAGYRRCQSDNAEEFGEGEDWFTKRTQRVVAKLRESLKAGEVDPLAIDNAVDLLIDQSKALALANPTPAPRVEIK